MSNHEVEQAWREVIDLLTEVAPVTAASIRPSTNTDFDAAERELGFPLNDELRAWFGLHDGAEQAVGTVLPSFGLVGLDEAVRTSNTIFRIWSSGGDTPATDGPAGSWAYSWHRQFVQIGEWDADSMFVDLRAGPLRGCVRYFAKEDNDMDDERWDSITALLQEIHNSISTGTPTSSWVPNIQHGILDWTIAPGLVEPRSL